MTGSPGAAPVFLRELGRRRIALSDAASAPFGPKPPPRIRTRYTTGSTIAARTGRQSVIGSRRRASPPAPPLSRRRPNGHPGSATTGLYTKGRKRQDRDNRITAIGKKRGQPHRSPRVITAANTGTTTTVSPLPGRLRHWWSSVLPANRVFHRLGSVRRLGQTWWVLMSSRSSISQIRGRHSECGRWRARR